MLDEKKSNRARSINWLWFKRRIRTRLGGQLIISLPASVDESGLTDCSAPRYVCLLLRIGRWWGAALYIALYIYKMVFILSAKRIKAEAPLRKEVAAFAQEANTYCALLYNISGTQPIGGAMWVLCSRQKTSLSLSLSSQSTLLLDKRLTSLPSLDERTAAVVCCCWPASLFWWTALFCCCLP